MKAEQDADLVGVGQGADLISAAQLGRLLRDGSRPVVIDVRWQLNGPSSWDAYLAGHVPSAGWADLEHELAGPPGRPGRHPLPNLEQLQRAVQRWGIAPEKTVVVYDARDSTAAARAWWMLKWAGLGDVRVLDGGLAAWQSAGGMLETGPPRPRPSGTVVLAAGAMATLDAEGAQRIATVGALVDARAFDRFAGHVEPVDAVAGHIPGAVNVPTTQNVGPDGRFLPAQVLAARFAAVGIREPVGAYCGSGVTAAHTVLALRRAGIDAALYVGSWSEWITDASRPVATGPT